MLKGIDINQKIEFSSKTDKEETKTIFVLKPLSGIQMLEINGIVSLLLEAIFEIKNPDVLGKDDIEKYLNTCSTGVLTELIDEINKINKITDDESKN